MVRWLLDAELIEDGGQLGARLIESPMDTDDERAQRYTTLMTFRDQAQMNAAYATILEGTAAEVAHHLQVLRSVRNPIFTCWQEGSTGS